MSVLHNPGPGEILDRITILSLKLTYGALARHDLTQWQEELRALWLLLAVPHAWAVSAGLNYADLAAVNAALWQAEDHLRALRAEDPSIRLEEWTQDAQRTGFHIQSLNDRRADLVALINREAGLDRPQEKL